MTPAAAIARATRPDQQVVACAVGELPARLAAAALPGPVLVMVGQSLRDAAVVPVAMPALSTANG